MSNVMTIDGTPIMTYGLTAMLIATLTYSTFVPSQEPGQEPNNNYMSSIFTSDKGSTISSAFSKLSIPAFSAPIPALLSPPTQSVSDIFSTVVGTDPSKSLTDASKSALTDASKSATDALTDASKSATDALTDASKSATDSIKSATDSIKSATDTPKSVTDAQEEEREKEKEEEELGLRGGKKKKKRKTRKYKR